MVSGRSILDQYDDELEELIEILIENDIHRFEFYSIQA